MVGVLRSKRKERERERERNTKNFFNLEFQPTKTTPGLRDKGAHKQFTNACINV